LDQNEAQGRWLLAQGLLDETRIRQAWSGLSEEPGLDLCGRLLQWRWIAPQAAREARAAGARSSASLRPVSDEDSFGGYEVLSELGRGGMGVAFLARDSQSGRKVVIKCVTESLVSRTGRERFRREALALAKVRHGNVVRVLTTGERDEQPYLVMDYIEGSSLEGWLAEHAAEKEGRLEVLVRIFAELLEGLAACHAAGVVHRDLKPENIMVTQEDNRAVLVDFGIAKLDPLAADESLESLTQSGQIVGTPAFMAPEQLFPGEDFGPTGPASDVWGFGATLFFALTGETVYPSMSALGHMAAAASVEPRRVRSLSHEVPGWLDKLCAACLRRHTSERCSLDEVRRSLATCRAPPRRRSRQMVRNVLALACVLFLIAGLGFSLRSNPDLSPPRIEIEGANHLIVTREDSLLLAGVVRDEKLGARLLIAGKPQALDSEGRFSCRIPVIEGRQEILLQATDRSGNESAPLMFYVLRDQRAPKIRLDPVRFEEAKIILSGTLSEEDCRVTLAGQQAEIKGRKFRLSIAPEGQLGGLKVIARDLAGNKDALPLPFQLVNPKDGPEGLQLALKGEAGSGTVLVPPGDYRLDLALLKGPALRILGAGPGSVRVNLAGGGLLLTERRVRLAGLRFSRQAPSGAGLTLRGRGELRLEDCVLESKGCPVIRVLGAKEAPFPQLHMNRCEVSSKQSLMALQLEQALVVLRRVRLSGSAESLSLPSKRAKTGLIQLKRCPSFLGIDLSIRDAPGLALQAEQSSLILARSEIHGLRLGAIQIRLSRGLFLGCRFFGNSGSGLLGDSSFIDAVGCEFLGASVELVGSSSASFRRTALEGIKGVAAFTLPENARLDLEECRFRALEYGALSGLGELSGGGAALALESPAPVIPARRSRDETANVIERLKSLSLALRAKAMGELVRRRVDAIPALLEHLLSGLPFSRASVLRVLRENAELVEDSLLRLVVKPKSRRQGFAALLALKMLPASRKALIRASRISIRSKSPRQKGLGFQIMARLSPTAAIGKLAAKAAQNGAPQSARRARLALGRMGKVGSVHSVMLVNKLDGDRPGSGAIVLALADLAFSSGDVARVFQEASTSKNNRKLAALLGYACVTPGLRRSGKNGLSLVIPTSEAVSYAALHGLDRCANGAEFLQAELDRGLPIRSLIAATLYGNCVGADRSRLLALGEGGGALADCALTGLGYAGIRAAPLRGELIALLADPRLGELREGCAWALAEAGPSQAAVAALIEALEDDSPSLRRAAALALGRLGESAEAALGALKNAGAEPAVKAASDEARARIRGELPRLR